ncbi:S-layer homology domain-containing protein [Paenibacillus hodogayensis]|uniref:S-layer homology domain-containing protein n=1 Tax=Paenibacillus hodogayensis TaxID=279208 RepID=A0ABV5W3A9_9BACL
MTRTIRIIAMTLIGCLLTLNASEAWAAVNRLSQPPAGWQIDAPPENTFQVAGSDETYILLNSTGSHESAFFVMAKEAYGSRAFDPDNTTKFDPADSNNIAYWLNHEFLTEGSKGKKLHSSVIRHINPNHVWATEGCRSDSICPNDYTVQAGVSLLSQTEYASYAPRFGVRDGVGSSAAGWWLRTARGLSATSPNLMLRVRTDDAALGQTHEIYANYTSTFVKPVFYLNADFFAQTKLSVSTMGSRVKQTILARYSREQLQALGSAQYTDEELKKIGYTVPDSILLSDFEEGLDGWASSSPNAVLTQSKRSSFEGQASAGVTVQFADNRNEARIDKHLSVPLQVRELRLQLASSDMAGVTVEMTDTNGLVTQVPLVLPNGDGEWTEAIVVKDDAMGLIGKISLLLQRDRMLAGKSSGTVYFDAVKAIIPAEWDGNGGFEYGLWAERTGQVQVDASSPHSGTNAAKLTGGPVPASMSALLKVDPGEPADLSAWIRTDLLSAVSFVQFDALELDAKGNVLGGPKTLYWAQGPAAGGWRQIAVSLGQLDRRAAYIKLSVKLLSDGGSVLYADDFSIRPFNETATISFKQAGYIFDPEEVKIGLTFGHNSLTSKTYTVVPVVPTDVRPFAPTVVEVAPNTDVPLTVELPGLKNGLHKLRVEVKEGERTVQALEQEFSVMPTYKPKFGDRYSITAISAHFALENRNKPEEADLIAKAGFRTVRDELQWHKVEKQQGRFDFARHDGWVNKLSENGIKIIGTVNGNAGFYGGLAGTAESFKYGPKTLEELDAISQYAYELASHYKGKVDVFEIWNEPNLVGFWMPAANVNDYAVLVKRVASAIRKANPDAVIIAGSVANQQGTAFLNDMLERGVYPYIDAISYHPYIWPEDPDATYAAKLDSYANTLKNYGRWKDLYVTEINWHTTQSTRGVSEELQARYLIKHYAISAMAGLKISSVYDWRDDGADVTASEHNYGITHFDYSAKRALIALNQFNRELGTAQFIGEMHLAPGMKTYAYLQEGRPVLLMWTDSGAAVFNFGQEAVAVADMDGNAMAVAAGAVPVGANPVYVKGLSDAWLMRAISSRLVQDYDRWLAATAADLGEATVSGIRPAIRELADNAAALKARLQPPAYAEAADKLKQHFALGSELIRQAGQGQASPEAIMSALYQLYRAGEGWARLVAVSGNPPAAHGTPASLQEVEAAQQLENERVRQFGGGTLPRAAEILRHAKERAALAGEYGQNGRNGLADAWDATASELSRWSREMAEFETASRTDIFMHVSPSSAERYEGEETELKVTIDSQLSPVAGQVRIVDENGNVAGTVQELSLAGGGRTEVRLRLFEGLEGKARVQLVEHGRVLQQQLLPVSTKSKLSLSLMPSEAMLSNLDQLQVKLSNLFTAPSAYTVQVKAPEGWKLRSDSLQITLAPQSEQVLSFPVENIAGQPFNEYIFQITVTDAGGNTVYNHEHPLSFLVSVKAAEPVNPAASDSQLSAWERAYPIFLNPPSRPGSGQAWMDSNAAGKLYTMWDENAFYVMAKVYDDYFSNNMYGASIWNGDSLQLAFDTTNLKTTAYHKNMYEYTFALTGAGEESFAFYAAAGKEPGKRPAEWSKITRDDSRKLTLYTIRIPKEELVPLTLRNEQAFGFNVAINDADMLDRDHYYEFTKGLASTKNPSFYYTWKLQEERQQPKPPRPASNLALLEPVVSSDGSPAAALAVDGDKTTGLRWNRGQEPAWLYVDLGASKPVNQISLFWGEAFAKSYRIQLSQDARQWTDIHASDTGTGEAETIAFEERSARYVRLLMLADAQGDGYDLKEMGVYGPETLPDSLALDQSSLRLTTGESAQLTARVLPDHATNRRVVWTTGNRDVATVDGNGHITAAGIGQTVIRATTLNGEWSAEASVTVRERGSIHLSAVHAGSGSVALSWTGAPGAVMYQVYGSENAGMYNKPLVTVNADVYGYKAEGLANGQSYYFVVKAQDGDGTWISSNEVSAAPKTHPSAPTGVTAAVYGNGQVWIRFNAPADDGGSPVTGYEATAFPGGRTVYGSASPIAVSGLNESVSYVFTVKAINSEGKSPDSLPSNAVVPFVPREEQKGNDPDPVQEPPMQGGVSFPSHEEEKWILERTVVENGRTVTLFTISENKLKSILASTDKGGVIEVPVQTQSNAAILELTGKSMQNMKEKQASIRINTGDVTYTLPDSAIDIRAWARELGVDADPENIRIRLEIAEPDAAMRDVADKAASREGFTLMAPPVQFTLRLLGMERVKEWDKFPVFVERSFLWTEAMADKTITGIRIAEDGTVGHVPTKTVVRDGKRHIVLSSLTNSMYAVVHRPIGFSDLEGHWAKRTVEEMGARMIVQGAEQGLFQPDRDMTRAEFAAVIVRALGLKPQAAGFAFADVASSDWYSGIVQAAFAYKLIDGYEDGTFRPANRITREEAIQLVSRAMEVTGLRYLEKLAEGESGLKRFEDSAQISEWARSSMTDGLSLGLIDGQSAARLAPQNPITRAEAATILHRLLQKAELI